jgi:hypothetical protein
MLDGGVRSQIRTRLHPPHLLFPQKWTKRAKIRARTEFLQSFCVFGGFAGFERDEK